MKRYNSIGSTIFDIFNVLLMLIIIIITLYPLYHIVIVSISDGMAVMRGEVKLWPKGITFDSYRVIFQNRDIFVSFKNTVVYTVVGTAINLVMSCLCAYPLSRPNFSGRKLFTKLIVFTMFFNGGMIPMYLLVNSLGLMNSMWAVILPVAINTSNMIVIRTGFLTIPESLIESAKIDGANDFYILGKIALPLIKPVMATMLLFYAVSHWNSFFNAMLYLNEKSKYPLQIVLRNMIVSGIFSEEASQMGRSSKFRVTDTTIRYAVIMFTTFPILMVYPFLQKYFVKGVMIGSLKG